jgi:hypothetical protein
MPYDSRNGGSINPIPYVVLITFAFVGIVSALYGRYILSGIFALFFIAYSVIRLPVLAGRPLLEVPQNVRRFAFVIGLVGILLYIAYNVAKHFQR